MLDMEPARLTHVSRDRTATHVAPSGGDRLHLPAFGTGRVVETPS